MGKTSSFDFDDKKDNCCLIINPLSTQQQGILREARIKEVDFFGNVDISMPVSMYFGYGNGDFPVVFKSIFHDIFVTRISVRSTRILNTNASFSLVYRMNLDDEDVEVVNIGLPIGQVCRSLVPFQAEIPTCALIAIKIVDQDILSNIFISFRFEIEYQFKI